VIAGLLAKQFGPVFGGLFLAFPAIFPASVTLVEKHEREKKQKAGIMNSVRGRQAAALDAPGCRHSQFRTRLLRVACLEIASRLEHRGCAVPSIESVVQRLGINLAGA
jgi:hypothetical protein